MRSALLLLPAFIAFFAGCSAPRGSTSTLDVAPGEYARTFDAAREALLELRFELDRVDARAGILSTSARRSAGLATPWAVEQTTPAQEFEDFVNRHARIVRITFEPAGAPSPERPHPPLAAGDPLPDLLERPGPLVARVQVLVLRTRRPGWRPDGNSIFRSSFTHDPSLRPRGMTPRYEDPLILDEALSRRLAVRIEALRSRSR